MSLEKPEANENLEEFRSRVEDLNQSDDTLQRFFTARESDPNSAELMLRNSIQWRQVNDLDNSVNWHISDLIVKSFPIEYPGVDYENREIVYIPIGSWPIREMLEAGYKYEMLQNIYVSLERIMYKVKSTGGQCTLIADFAETTCWKFAHYETVKQVFRIFRDSEANYPEQLAAAWVINMPYYLKYPWSLIKPLLNRNTLSKVTFLGSNRKKYMRVLLKQMPSSSIPTPLRKRSK